MDADNINSANRFDKHPVLTLAFLFLFLIVVIDFLSANIYKIINGYSWNDSLLLQNKIEKSYRVKSEVYHHDFKKNMSIKSARYRSLRYAVTTNSLGFKDKEVRDIPLSSDKYRLLFIGDSFTEGIGVPYEDTFVGQIDTALAKDHIEVFNAAVASYSPTIYWRKIKYLIENTGFKFNEAVVFLDMSDIIDEATSYCLDEGGFVVARDPATFSDEIDGLKNNQGIISAKKMLKNFLGILRDNSIILYSAFTYTRTKFKGYGRREFHIQYGWASDKTTYGEFGEKGLKKCEMYMNKLADLLQANHIKLIVAVYPWPQQISYGYADTLQETFWSNWCKNKNVLFLNIFPSFIAGKDLKERERLIDRYFIEGDCHWNISGHKFISDIFLDSYRKPAASL